MHTPEGNTKKLEKKTKKATTKNTSASPAVPSPQHVYIRINVADKIEEEKI